MQPYIAISRAPTCMAASTEAPVRSCAASMSRSSGTDGSIRSSPSSTANGASPTQRLRHRHRVPEPERLRLEREPHGRDRRAAHRGQARRACLAPPARLPASGSARNDRGSRPAPGRAPRSRPRCRRRAPPRRPTGSRARPPRAADPWAVAFVAGRNRVPNPAAGITALRTVMAAESSRGATGTLAPPCLPTSTAVAIAAIPSTSCRR